MPMDNVVEKEYSTYEVHQMLEERAGEKISEYDLRTLMDCWRLSRREFDKSEQSGFTQEDVDDFLAYAYWK